MLHLLHILTKSWPYSYHECVAFANIWAVSCYISTYKRATSPSLFDSGQRRQRAGKASKRGHSNLWHRRVNLLLKIWGCIPCIKIKKWPGHTHTHIGAWDQCNQHCHRLERLKSMPGSSVWTCFSRIIGSFPAELVELPCRHLSLPL